jgi:hypothetical protein
MENSFSGITPRYGDTLTSYNISYLVVLAKLSFIFNSPIKCKLLVYARLKNLKIW